MSGFFIAIKLFFCFHHTFKTINLIKAFLRNIYKGGLMDALIKYLEDVRRNLNEFIPETADDVDKLLRDYVFLVSNYYEMGHVESVIEAKKKAFTKLRDRLNIAIDNISM